MHINYSDLFTGYGIYDKEYHIAIKPNAKGVVQTSHQVPYTLQSKLDIIAANDEPTDWVNGIVVMERKNK